MDMKEKILSLSRGNDATGSPGLVYNGVREAVCPSPDTRMSGSQLKELSVREKVMTKANRQNIIFANTYANLVSPIFA